MSDADRFDWADDASVIVLAQLAVAVYRNARGDIVIRQQADWGDDEDKWVILSPSHARALAEAILLEAGEIDAAPLVLPAPDKPKDPTAAERQRRFRESRKRNGVTGEGVMAETVTDNARNGVTGEPVCNHQHEEVTA